MGVLTYRSGVPDRSGLNRQLGHLSGEDDASLQISMVLTTPWPGGSVECCYDDDLMVGLIQLSRETHPDHIYIRHWSVLPTHQRKRIGKQLLESTKGAAREGKLPVFVHNVSEVAIEAFKKCDFWQVAGTQDNPVLKWSDLPEHLNNDHPEKYA